MAEHEGAPWYVSEPITVAVSQIISDTMDEMGLKLPLTHAWTLLISAEITLG